MKQLHAYITVADLCSLFGKTRQAYYKKLAISDKHQERADLILDYVKDEREEQSKIGALKLRYMLQRDTGITIGRDAFYNLLRDNKLLIKRRKKYSPRTTDGDGKSIYPDLRKELIVEKINSLWSADVTYFKLLQGQPYCYATFIVDEFSHLIVGWTLAKDMTAAKTLVALEQAIESQLDSGYDTFDYKLVFHTDRGSQFKSDLFQKCLSKYEIKCSMTQDGKPSDNPVSERINGIIKNELLTTDQFDNFAQAKKLIAKAVEIYNNRRPHLSCSLLTPKQAHNIDQQPLKKMWRQRKKRPSEDT